MNNKKIVKACIFKKNTPIDIVTTTNGDQILDNILLSAVTDEHLYTGEYYLDFSTLLDHENKIHELIEEEAIVKVHMDYGDEIFSIAKVSKNSMQITAFARQITISEMLDMWLEDVRPTKTNGQGALSTLRDNSKGKKDISVSSDISELSTAYYMDMNLYKAVFDCEQSFINRWGGEIQRRGYHLTINKKIGQNRGIQIRSRKNLTGFEANTDIDKVVTRIKPKGFNGITIDGYVDSPLIDIYKNIKTKEIKYDDVKVKEKEDDEGFDTLEQAQAELIRRSKLEFSVNQIDKIKADYRVNFVQLEYTEEYKEYVQAERVYLGDEVEVYEEKLNTNITARAVRRRFDVLKQRVIEVELSNAVKKDRPPTINDVINNINKVESNINKKNEWFENAINDVTSQIQGGLKNSYVVVMENEILIMDSKDINTATNVWRWNQGGLAHSKAGYFGNYDTAITQDGKIIAKFLYGLEIKGEQIVAGVIRNKSGSLRMDLDDDSFRIGKFDSSDSVEHTNEYSKYKHSDGTYTQIGVNGLERRRYDSNYIKDYHYLTAAGTVRVGGGINVPDEMTVYLPSDFAGKSFEVFLSIAMTGTYDTYYTLIGLTGIRCAVTGKDFEKGSFKVRGNSTFSAKETFGAVHGYVDITYIAIA